MIASRLWVLVLASLTTIYFSNPVNTRKEINMGAVKKAYQDWCERNDKNPDDDLTNSDLEQAMQDLQHESWRKEFEDWLDGIAQKYSRDGGEYD